MYDNYDKQELENGDILLKKKPVDLDWKPEIEDELYYVACDGEIEYEEYAASETEKRIFEFNVGYSSEKQAAKAAELMRRSNAYIRACLLVDPDFERDWDNPKQDKWSIYYSHQQQTHHATCSIILQEHGSHVSTQDKALEVIKLLVKWGVK